MLRPALAVLVVLVVLLAGCGDGGSDAPARPLGDGGLGRTLELARDAGRLDLHLSATTTRPGRGTRPQFDAKGEIDLGSRAGEATLHMSMGEGLDLPELSIDWTADRVEANGRTVPRELARTSGGQLGLLPDETQGLAELVADADDAREGYDGPTPAGHSIRGFHHAALAARNAEGTIKLMTDHLGFRQVDEAENRVRLAAGDGGPGNLVDVMDATGFPRGNTGVGTVHHIAFRVPDEESQLAVREEVAGLGYDVTPVLDRNYFRSIYFREPGGVLFEVATDPPGFAADENPAHLGEELKLPPWLEERRGQIEDVLTPLRVPGKEDA